MIRVFIDDLGTGHKDVFLKVDSFPEYLEVGDSYYFRIFNEDNGEFLFSETIKAHINNWKNYVEVIEKRVVLFLPFGIYDQSISGLIVESVSGFGKQNILQIQIGHIEGGGFGFGNLDLVQLWGNEKDKCRRDTHFEWLMTKTVFLEGLWSINKLDKNL